MQCVCRAKRFCNPTNLLLTEAVSLCLSMSFSKGRVDGQ